MVKGLILFPEILNHRPDKFNRFAVWLINRNSVVCPNVRDIFTAGGQGSILFNERTYTKIPKIIVKLIDLLPQIKELLFLIDYEELSLYWEVVPENRHEYWLECVNRETHRMVLPFNLVDVLRI